MTLKHLKHSGRPRIGDEAVIPVEGTTQPQRYVWPALPGGQFVNDLMDRGVLTLPRSVTLSRAAQTMADEDAEVALVPIAGQTLGSISSTAVAAALSSGQNPDEPAASVCTSPLMRVAPDADLATTAQMMKALGVQLVVVEDEGEAIAVLTWTSLAALDQ